MIADVEASDYCRWFRGKGYHAVAKTKTKTKKHFVLPHLPMNMPGTASRS